MTPLDTASAEDLARTMGETGAYLHTIAVRDRYRRALEAIRHELIHGEISEHRDAAWLARAATEAIEGAL